MAVWIRRLTLFQQTEEITSRCSNAVASFLVLSWGTEVEHEHTNIPLLMSFLGDVFTGAPVDYAFDVVRSKHCPSKIRACVMQGSHYGGVAKP